MTAAALLERARAAGVNIALESSGTLLVTGDKDARARLLPEVREHKPALVALLSQAPAPDKYRHEWRVTPPDGECFTASCTPPATLAEMRNWYPNARIEPEPDASLEPIAEEPTPAPAQVVDPPAQQHPAPLALVACAACRHYQANAHGWGGLGACQAAAPASREPGSLWPRSAIRCPDFAPIEVTP